MGRLKEVAPRVGSASKRLLGQIAEQSRDARREQLAPWRRWYKTSAWQKLRWQCLVSADFTCARCGWMGGAETHQLVADHVRAHRGDRAMFFASANLQCLCKPCHDGHKQRVERASASMGGWVGSPEGRSG